MTMKISEMKTDAAVRQESLRDPEFRAEWDRTAFAEAVALRVIGYRVEHQLTQTALARQLSMKQPAVARLESGDVTPSLDTLSRLASRLGITFHIDITPEGVAV
jgi:ribosome-binding protein aMBF1 (putative translation factor)